MQRPLVRTELVQVPVTEYAPLPAALTDPLPAIPPPPRNCHYADGTTPAVCALDGLLWIVRPQSVIERADADRATAGKLSAGAGLTHGDGATKP